jgi:hypothetical protein
MKASRALLIVLCVWLGACWEFIEPEFAEQDASTVMQVNATLNDQGSFNVNALLIPGLDDGGFIREVVRDTLYIFGLAIASDSSTRTGTRAYRLTTQLAPAVLAQPFTINPPVVSDISTGPRVVWSSARTLEADTIRLARGVDVRIRIAYDSAQSIPRPGHQWFLELVSGSQRFQVGANTAPPAELLIPAEWIPQSQDSVVRAFFTHSQSALVFLNDYRGAYNYTVQFDHTIIIQ